MKLDSTPANLIRGLLAALASALLIVHDPGSTNWGGGVAFTLLVLWPEVGFRPWLLLASVLVFVLNMRSLDLLPSNLPAWINPIALVGSFGLAAALAWSGVLGKAQALRLALLGTLLGYLFKWGLDLLPGREAIGGPRWMDFFLGFWAWQGPVAWFIHRHKRRSA
jgi:hypothetical protein